jgi:hypothetical protein
MVASGPPGKDQGRSKTNPASHTTRAALRHSHRHSHLGAEICMMTGSLLVADPVLYTYVLCYIFHCCFEATGDLKSDDSVPFWSLQRSPAQKFLKSCGCTKNGFHLQHIVRVAFLWCATFSKRLCQQQTPSSDHAVPDTKAQSINS